MNTGTRSSESFNPQTVRLTISDIDDMMLKYQSQPDIKLWINESQFNDASKPLAPKQYLDIAHPFFESDVLTFIENAPSWQKGNFFSKGVDNCTQCGLEIHWIQPSLFYVRIVLSKKHISLNPRERNKILSKEEKTWGLKMNDSKFTPFTCKNMHVLCEACFITHYKATFIYGVSSNENFYQAMPSVLFSSVEHLRLYSTERYFSPKSHPIEYITAIHPITTVQCTHIQTPIKLMKPLNLGWNQFKLIDYTLKSPPKNLHGEDVVENCIYYLAY